MRTKLTAQLMLVVSMLAGLLVALAAPARANHTVPVTVTITRVTAVGDDLEDLRGDEDLYAGVRIAGVMHDSFAVHQDGDADISPMWAFTQQVTAENTDTPVSIEVWEHDDCTHPFCNDTGALESDDDKADVDPGADGEVNLSVTLADGRWTGDKPWPANCSQGTGDSAAKVCWDIAVGGSDSDGDGLLDGWERNGYNADGDTTIDVDLPRMGADPLRKDIFVEMDITPSIPGQWRAPGRADIQAVKRALAVAPIANPGGGPNGVNLWVDTGWMFDPNASETPTRGTCYDGADNDGMNGIDGADPDCVYLDVSEENPAGDCGDGVDNGDGDGADAADPQCLIGDNLGNGNTLTPLNNCNLDQTFTNTKATFFAPARELIFRYAISTPSDRDTDGTTGPDTGCGSGGQAIINGNVFIDHNSDGGTILHELGHSLNLQHGGDKSTDNCKPNHVSTMNYDLQGGIPRTNGGRVLDFSPPRIDINLDIQNPRRGTAPLAELNEAALDESVPLDRNDDQNRFTFVDRAGRKVRTTNLNVAPDWAGDGGAVSTSVRANIDTSGPPDAAGNRDPAACTNNDFERLTGHNDWNRVVIPFKGFGRAADGGAAIDTDVDHQLPTKEVLDRMWQETNTADVGVTLNDSPDPVGAGEVLTWTVTASNHGPNPATSVEVATTLPADVAYLDNSVPCSAAGNAVTCNLGELDPGESRSYIIRAAVPADLVYRNGGPKTITATAAVDNLPGPDPSPANDTASQSTVVIAKADVKVTGASATSAGEVLIGQAGSASLGVTVENSGPSTPADTVLTTTATADDGVVVTPATATVDQAALAVGSPQSITSAVSLECRSPGVKTVTLQAQIALKNAADVDPDLTNNQRSVSFQVDCVVPIAINVRPEGFPNSINLRTDATLAALTTQAGEYGLPLAFDATSIDASSVLWGLRSNLFNVAAPAGAREVHGVGHPERSYELDERTVDADLDLVLHFKPSESGLTSASTEGCLKGKFHSADGGTYTFLGCDSVRVVPSK